MIFIQLIQNKNIQRNLGCYISLASLICSVLAVIEIKFIPQSSTATNCLSENHSEKSCEIIKLKANKSPAARK